MLIGEIDVGLRFEMNLVGSTDLFLGTPEVRCCRIRSV